MNTIISIYLFLFLHDLLSFSPSKRSANDATTLGARAEPRLAPKPALRQGRPPRPVVTCQTPAAGSCSAPPHRLRHRPVAIAKPLHPYIHTGLLYHRPT